MANIYASRRHRRKRRSRDDDVGGSTDRPWGVGVDGNGGGGDDRTTVTLYDRIRQMWVGCCKRDSLYSTHFHHWRLVVVRFSPGDGGGGGGRVLFRKVCGDLVTSIPTARMQTMLTSQVFDRHGDHSRDRRRCLWGRGDG